MSEGQNIVEKLLATKVRDIPQNFYASFRIFGYHVRLEFDEDYPPEVSVKLLRNGHGEESEVDIRDPDPELTVGDIFNTAKTAIESLIRKQ